MIYLASHHAEAEVVCNSLKPPVEKSTMIYLWSAFVLDIREILIHAGCSACASWLPWGSPLWRRQTHTVPWWGRRKPCPPERLPLASFQQAILTSISMVKNKIQLLFQRQKISKQKRKCKASLGMERYPHGTLLHMKWSVKLYLSCITFSTCSESCHLKDAVHCKAVSFWYHAYCFGIPRALYIPAFDIHMASNPEGLPFRHFKVVFQSRVRVLKQLFLEYSLHYLCSSYLSQMIR